MKRAAASTAAFILLSLAACVAPESDTEFHVGCSGSSSGGAVCDQWVDETFDVDLSAWSQLNASSASTSLSSGQLRVTPGANTLWYNSYGYAASGLSGWQLYHQCDGAPDVEGDWRATMQVQVSNAAGTAAAGTPWQFIGLQARDPVASMVEAVQADVGSTGTGNFSPLGPNLATAQQGVFEWKSTDDNVSTWGVTSPANQWNGVVRARLCKVGSDFRILGDNGSGWTSYMTVTRTDLDNRALAVGPVAYAYSGSPDILGRIDSVSIEPVTAVADCSTN